MKTNNMYIFQFPHLRNMENYRTKILNNLFLAQELKFLNTKKIHLILFFGNHQHKKIQDGIPHGEEEDQVGIWNVQL